ncbi:PREDICTED: apolipoprotein F [Gavialis gangeticus]|uniref:apolipoprotein F n=1 Tax=Gavialis gangeticus TaxID=94835 RepID=UPI00092FD44E|nr:PREDICTED: apolipoprotein F [Gavialis gangeticus]
MTAERVQELHRDPSAMLQSLLRPLLLLLLCHCLQGHVLPKSAPAQGTAEPRDPASTPVPAPSDSPQAAARLLLASLSQRLPPQRRLAAMGVSCSNMLPHTLRGSTEMPPLPRALASAALALALHGAGCAPEAEALVLELYAMLEVPDADALLMSMAELPHVGWTPLLSLLGQLWSAAPARCSGLVPLAGVQLQGPAGRVHLTFPGATAACSRLGPACAGVAPYGTTAYRVVGPQGASFVATPGARAWLHQCQRAGRHRVRREACDGETEPQVHAVVSWLPVVSTFYNMGTGLYYAYNSCMLRAEERAVDLAWDLGFDTIALLTGGTSGFVANVVLGSGLKAGVRALVSHFTQDVALTPSPSLSPVTFSYDSAFYSRK